MWVGHGLAFRRPGTRPGRSVVVRMAGMWAGRVVRFRRVGTWAGRGVVVRRAATWDDRVPPGGELPV